MKVHRRFFARGVIVAAAVCLLLLQAMSLLAPLAASAGGQRGTILERIYLAAHCDTHKDGAPASHADHSECCVLCSSGARDVSFLAVAILAGVILALTPRAASTLRLVPLVQHRPPPTGWRSSWSSRAPPAFA